MNDLVFEFTGELWLYPGEGGWHFVTLPKDVADEIDEVAEERAGFGSIPVEVTVGTSIWFTSLFPDKAAGSFVLPVKKAVREKEHLASEASVRVQLRLDSERGTRSGSHRDDRPGLRPGSSSPPPP